MKDFFSQSQNFIGAQQTGIDPRTGAFTLSLPLANINANYGFGPEIDFTLRSHSSSTKDEGFGLGFGLPFTTYDQESKLLRLSSGEQYLMEDNSMEFTVKQKKLHNFVFERFADYYKVTYKSGVVEILEGPSSGYSLKKTKRIETYMGHYVELDWAMDRFHSLLRLSDAHHCLLSIDYDDIHRPVVSVYPDSPDEYSIALVLTDRLLKQVIQVEENYRWHFGYTSDQVINYIKHPTGLEEQVFYQAGIFRFPPGESTQLPALSGAIRHIRKPGNGQPEESSSYRYTSSNYLGYGSDITFYANQDNLYRILNAYTYGSTETTTKGNLTIEVERTYNNFHLNTREHTTFRSSSGVNSILVHLEYYAIVGIPLEDQPAQFQLVKSKRTLWRDTQNRVREEEHLTEFDSHGNPTLEIQPDGSQTQLTWYDADGEDDCPAEVNGFVRFLKESITTPNQNDYDTPIQGERYCYDNLGDSDLIVPSQLWKYSDGELLQSRLFDYEEDPDCLDYGRMIFIHDKLYPQGEYGSAYDSYQSFEFDVDGDELTQETIFTGHDGCEASTSTTYSIWAQRVLGETSAQGIVTSYTYDSLGRILSTTHAEATAYENTSDWVYELTPQGPVTYYTDALGNQAKVYFDGFGREISKSGFDREGTGTWQEILEQGYQVGGALKYKKVKDVQDANNQSTSYAIQTDIGYDDWGQMSVLHFTNGIMAHEQTNPVALTTMRWQSGGSMRSGQWRKTMYPESQLLEKEERLNLQGQVVATNLYYWDGLGRLREEVDALGHSVERTYDAYGRVLTQTHADGTVLEYAYVPFLTGTEIAAIRVTSPDGEQWLLGEQTFDSLGRLLVQQTGGRTTEYLYEGSSPVPATVIQPDGTEIYYEYIPELGNVISQMETDGIVQSFEYDPTTGELLEAIEAEAVNQQEWDDLGRLKAETITVNGDFYDTDYQWTLRGEPTFHSDITGAQTRYERDQHGRVARIVDRDITANLSYDSLGRLIRKSVQDRNSTTNIDTQFEYNEFNQPRVELLTDSKGSQLRLEREWLNNGLLDRQVTQLNGVIIKAEDYAYDVRNRLVEYTINGSEFPSDGYGHKFCKQAYQYDALNNLLSVETTLEDQQVDVAYYHYNNPQDPTQLSQVTHSNPLYPAVIDLEYDTCGRMTLDEAGRLLSYDALGRLIQVEGQADSNYQYNAVNQLINQTIEGDKNCQLYYRGGELVNQVVVEDDKKVRWIKSGASCMGVHQDDETTLTAGGQNQSLLWSVKNSDAQGELHEFGPYGQGESESLLPAYNAERKDPISGHYHLGNGYRAYSPVLMRFTCPDTMSPFGAGGINAYAYCVGDPINLIDPTGHYVTGGVSSMAIGRYGGATGGIILGLVGIVTSIATFGASVAAMGAVAASVALTLSLAAEATGIASLAIGDKDPELSANLGWASLGLGIAGSIGGAYKKPVKGSYNLPKNTDKLGNIVVEGTFHNEEVINVSNKTIYNNEKEIIRNKICVLTAENYDQQKSNTVVLFAHGSSVVKDEYFYSRSTVGFYVNVGEKLKMNIVKILNGRRDLGPLFQSYRSGHRIPQQVIRAPYFPIRNRKTGDIFSADLKLTMKYMRTAMNEHPNSYPHAVAFIGTDKPMLLGEAVLELERHYTNIYVACCR